MKKEERQEFNSSFYTGAKINTNLESLVRYLDSILYIKRLESDTDNILKYCIIKPKDNNSECIFELSGTRICMKFSFEQQSATVYNNNLIAFISFLAILKEHYVVGLEEIYPCIVEALDQNWHNTVKNEQDVITELKERINSLNDSNCQISIELMKLSEANLKVLAENKLYKNFSEIVLNKTSAKRTVNSNFISNGILDSLGIEAGQIKQIADLLESKV